MRVTRALSKNKMDQNSMERISCGRHYEKGAGRYRPADPTLSVPPRARYALRVAWERQEAVASGMVPPPADATMAQSRSRSELVFS